MKLRGFTKDQAGWLTGNQISRLSAEFCLLGVPLTSEPTRLNWLLALLAHFKRHWLHFHPKPPRPIPAKSSGSAPVKVSGGGPVEILNPPAFPKKSAGFRNLWTPPESGAAFSRRRLLMTHQP